MRCKILNLLIFKVQHFFVGWNDVGYHNEQVISPNIDRLASEGIILGRNQGLDRRLPSKNKCNSM